MGCVCPLMISKLVVVLDTFGTHLLLVVGVVTGVGDIYVCVHL
jgi:hypothetical protein